MQNKLLLSTLSYAYNNTDYYKKLFNENNIKINSYKDLEKIPLLSKEIIKKNFSKLISKKYNIEYLIKKKTGGSTGEPLEFYCNSYSGLFDYGHHSYLCSLMGHKKGDIIISCGGVNIPEHLLCKNIYWVEIKKGNPFGDYIFSVLHLSNNNINIYVDKIIEMQPAILRGYPSFFNSLANHILKHNITLPFKIKGIILTAEMCSTNQQLNIEKAFSSMVYFEYGHTEVCLFCYTKDKTYTYESSPIYGYIEILNDDGSETKIGQIGNIIVTGFINMAMPFIRYKTGDLAKLKYRNAGVVYFDEFQGRQQSYALSKNKKKVYLNTMIFGLLAENLKRVLKWQIIQHKIGELEFYIIKTKDFSKKDELNIEKVIKNVIDLEINFIYVEIIPPTKNGKHLFFIQNISP
ncbi:MAG: hypothetical protein V3U92_00440 [Cellulophaga sp.]